ncbi:hypothetical protein [Pandoraea vervacti]|uniref:hypothetical protein n=1 Tax=Pandoraea vervacti TaxID=656178 RepID=UPI000A9B52FB|nr:hypothetical protein [Pandoraea vervacti]
MHFLPPESVCRAQSVTAWMRIKRQTDEDAPDGAKPNGNEADDEDGRFGIRRMPVTPFEPLPQSAWMRVTGQRASRAIRFHDRASFELFEHGWQCIGVTSIMRSLPVLSRKSRDKFR